MADVDQWGYEQEWSPDEDEPGCVVCGVRVPEGQKYCGPSCEQYDEGEPCTEDTERTESTEGHKGV